jgi:hypothetical protein
MAPKQDMANAKAKAIAKVKAKANAKAKAKAKAKAFPMTMWPARRFFQEHRGFMLDQDWVSRHEYFGRLSQWMPGAAFALGRRFSPCELLMGTLTGALIRRRRTIPLPDKAPIYRQMLITDYFNVIQQ